MQNSKKHIIKETYHPLGTDNQSITCLNSIMLPIYMLLLLLSLYTTYYLRFFTTSNTKTGNVKKGQTVIKTLGFSTTIS